jgi:pseudouridine-5'-phosphate glycosidase
MIQVSPAVEQAVRERRPVVALESTVLAHGLPRPRNLEVGRALEDDVRAGGAVPATIGVIGGTPVVGLSPAEVARMATSDGVLKLSTRDLAVPVARGVDGATTVAATMWLAARAGVRVFATGGIGGVHRGEARDVSADLTELGRTPMLVVCAGAKSVLDLPATREALETAGVLVAGWGTDELPAFYSRESGIPVDVRVDGAAEAAELWRAHAALGLPGAVLLCVPPPAEAALPAAEVESAIAAALRDAGAQGIRGKEVTPFLLRAVAAATGGRSLEANVALLRNNARVAAEVAAAVFAG